MKAYLISLVSAALVLALVTILSPDGERSGISKHIKLLSALLLVTALISPIFDLIDGLRSVLGGEIELPWSESTAEQDYTEQLQDALDSASTQYFSDMLTQTLEKQFTISTGEVRCAIQWQKSNDELVPIRVTVILSGKAIWKDPAEIEDFVTTLLGCECVSAIE